MTNCGHVFCGTCILRCASERMVLPCPLCRTRVSMLLSQQLPMAPQVHAFNTFHAGRPLSLMQFLRDMPVLLRFLWLHFRQIFFVSPQLTIFAVQIILIVVSNVIYLLSPFDLVPELIFGALGLIDDAVIIFLSCCLIAYFIRSIVLRR